MFIIKKTGTIKFVIICILPWIKFIFKIIFKDVVNSGLEVEMPDGSFVQLTVETTKNVSDGKLDGLLLGSTGAYCQNCRLSREEAHSVERIIEVNCQSSS